MLFIEQMDVIPEPPLPYEQVVTQKLLDCGLTDHGFTVKFEDYLQSYEVVIYRSANVAPDMYPCIRAAAGNEVVTFDDQELSSGYNAFLTELYRPKMIEDAEAELAKRGLLKGFPQRAEFLTDALFAEAIEVHCGLEKGEAIRPFGGALAFQPSPEAVHDFNKFHERYSCLISAIMLVSARNEMRIGFIGNGAFASPD